MAEMMHRWECPLRTCMWTWMGFHEDSLVAFLRHGEIRQHIESHDVLEWVQGLIDMRPVPIEVAPLQLAEPIIRRRSQAASLTYLADKLAEANSAQGGAKAWETVGAVEIALRALAMEAGIPTAEPGQPRRRTAPTVRHLQNVAEVYREAIERGNPPTIAVAEAFRTSHRTATRWVGLARNAALLDPTTQGRPSDG